LEKKEVAHSNWASTFTGSNRFGGDELSALRLKNIQANYLTEKADPAAPPTAQLFPVAFRRMKFEEFNTYVLETFKNLYKRNSANVSRVLTFLEFIGRGYFRRLSIDQLKDCVNPKVFEALNNKEEPIVISGMDTVQFFASLGKPELNDFLIQSTFSLIEKRNIEQVKIKALQICFSMTLSNSESIKAVYNMIKNCLEQIKTEEIKLKITQQFTYEGPFLAKKLATLDQFGVLLEPKGNDFSTSMRMILAIGIIEEKIKKPEEGKDLQPAIAEIFNSFVKKSLIENGNRLRSNNLETLAGAALVVNFNRLTGLLAEETGKIAAAMSTKDIDYYSDAFFKNNSFIFKQLLFRLLTDLDAHLKMPQKYFDLILGNLILDKTFDVVSVVRGKKLSLAFVVSCIRGVKVLCEYRETKADLGDFLWAVLDSFVSGDQLSVHDAHLVLDAVSSPKNALALAKEFNLRLLKAGSLSLYSNALKYPTDISKPVDYHYMGIHGLFSMYQDKQAYYHAYVASLFDIEIKTFFEKCMIFYDDKELVDMRLTFSRNSMIQNRNLDLEENDLKESYRELLEHWNYIKKEKKQKKKEGAPVVQTRDLPTDYRVAGDLEIKLVKSDAVYQEYAFYLKRVSDCAASTFEYVQKSNSDQLLALMELIKQSDIFSKLKLIARDNEQLRPSVKNLLESILKGLLLKISDVSFSQKFSNLYFQVVSNERSGHFSKSLEDCLKVVFNVRSDPNIHPAAVPILEDFSKYCFENMYDAEARRRAFDVILSMAEREPSTFLYNFIKDHLDDLYYFDDIREKLNKQITSVGLKDKTLLSGLLLKILDYQYPAQKSFLQSMLDLDDKALKSQDIGNFEKIKLIIITKDENKENAELAQKVLNRIGHQLEYRQIIDIDFLRMVKEIPFDLHEATGNIICEALKHLGKEEKKSFLNKLTQSCLAQVQDYIAKVKDFDDHPDDSSKQIDYKSVEETLGIYPVILSCLAPIWEDDVLEPLFDMIITLESNYLPNLTQKLCSTGITFVNVHKNHSKKLLQIFESRMKQREGIVTPLVLLGAAAKFVNKKESKLDLISDKIMSLTESADTTFQNKLGLNISRLLIFFENSGEVIETLLKRVGEEKDTNKIRGKCYAIAGLLRGLGAQFIEKHDIFGKIHIIVGK
jgi:hypothetical protein